MSNDKFSDLVSAQQTSVLQGAMETLNAAFAQGGDSRGKISEDAFVYHFLPFFSGNYAAPVLQGRNVMAEWIGIAGSATSEVDVIGNDGQIAFSVPAMFNTDTIGLQQAAANGTKSLADIMYEYNAVKDSAPRMAMNHVNNQLAEKYSSVHQDLTTTQTATARWIAIMARYGIQLNNAAPVQSPASQGDDDLLYE